MPSEKIALRASFRLVSIFKFHKTGKGSSMISISSVKLVTPTASHDCARLIQKPPGFPEGSQRYDSGKQLRKISKKAERLYKIANTITV